MLSDKAKVRISLLGDKLLEQTGMFEGCSLDEIIGHDAERVVNRQEGLSASEKVCLWKYLCTQASRADIDNMIPNFGIELKVPVDTSDLMSKQEVDSLMNEVEKLTSGCECGGEKTNTPHSHWCPMKPRRIT